MDRSSAHVSAESFFNLTRVFDQNAISSSKSRGRSKRATEGKMSTKRMAMIYGAIGRLDLHILVPRKYEQVFHNIYIQGYKMIFVIFVLF